MKYRRIAGIGPLAVSVLMNAGCASVVEGTTQAITVNTTPVSGASCTLTNKRGQWSVVTPGSVIVKRSESYIHVVCTKDGWQDSTAYLSPTQSTQAVMGAVLLFGVLESAVDASTGAGNKYPEYCNVPMKPIAPPSDNQTSPGTKAPAGTTADTKT